MKICLQNGKIRSKIIFFCQNFVQKSNFSSTENLFVLGWLDRCCTCDLSVPPEHIDDFGLYIGPGSCCKSSAATLLDEPYGGYVNKAPSRKVEEPASRGCQVYYKTENRNHNDGKHDFY